MGMKGACGRKSGEACALCLRPTEGKIWDDKGQYTSHVRLNVSKSTNSRATVSSVRFDLYCFSNRLHVSVYSDSVTESLM